VAVELDAPALLPLVNEALDSRQALAISYYSASTDRVTDRQILPLRLFGSEGHWYVDAWCESAAGVRRFRVDRINSAELVEADPDAGERPPKDVSDRGPGVEAGRGQDFEPFVPGPDARRVRLSLDPSTAWLIDSIPSAGPTEAVDGRVEVEIFVGGDAWLERLLLRLGPDARVVDPPAYRRLAAEAATRILRRYREG
jgi:proteasome accessory factor C